MKNKDIKTEGTNRTQTMRFYPFVFTGEVPCKGERTPLNSITFSEERNEETCYGYCNEYQPHAAVDDRYFSYYVYDHSGGSCASREQSQACLSYAEMEQRRRSQRRLKLTGINKQQDVNADLMATYTVLNEPTLYPSAYMALSNKGYTKHYYAGTERVAARLGGGGLDALQPVIGNDVELQRKADILFRQSLEQVNHRVLGENDLKCIMNNEFARDEFGKRIDGIPYHVRSDVKVDNWQFKNMIHSMLEDLHDGKEKDVYFYHSDHLGSASWITDSAGVAVQHIQYLPYGEPYIDQRPFGYSERFTFTGKERDEETGYGYFGARYMDHELMTMWLSVDPMADKYPSISPYNYCMWNPIKLVDPDGRDVEIVKDDQSKTVTVRANFYYNPQGMGKQSAFFMKKFKAALDAWGKDMQAALDSDPSLGASGFTVLFEYNCIESENPEKDARNDKDGIGNWITDDSSLPSSTNAKVVNNNNLRVNFDINRGDDNDCFEDFYNSHNGTIKHEIGHIFGLRDRYPDANDPAPYIENDLMSTDASRGNAVEPFKRVWRTAGFHAGTTRALINHVNNREGKN